MSGPMNSIGLFSFSPTNLSSKLLSAALFITVTPLFGALNRKTANNRHVQLAVFVSPREKFNELKKQEELYLS